MADAYTTLRANIRAGNLGPQDSKRRRQADSEPVVFRPHAAHSYDDRSLSWNYDQRTVSIWMLDGRVESASPVLPARWGQHRQARGHGVGIRQHARPGPRLSAAGRCDP
ncbi:hypothetical protein [Streptomyces sp. NPDC059165]|uniref:hypothetical protein n=1 Tax=Streptomyces sp. NPDC059165 TaxID=3346751 RepID=UPI003678C828